MKTYKVTFEIVLKNDSFEWIYPCLEEQLEPTEYIDNIKIEEVNNA